MAKNKTIQTIIRLYDERDHARNLTEIQQGYVKKHMDEATKYRKACEECWMHGDNGIRKLLQEQLGDMWGVNLEMKEIYGGSLKEQLNVQFPIHIKASDA